MERAFKIGCRVIFFDSRRQAHDAVVTNWFHGGPDGQTLAELQRVHDERLAKCSPEHRYPPSMPCCNVVFVSKDAEKTDPYGRQLERNTSVSYGRNQSTPFLGNCWAWPDEEEEATELASKSFDAAVAR